MSKSEKILTGLIMSFVMAFALSGFFVLTKMGFVAGWPAAWLKSFASAWPVAFVLSAIVGAPVSTLSRRLAGLLP